MGRSFLSRFPRWAVCALGVLLVLAVGLLDYERGWDFSIYALYLAPIALVGWLVGRRSAFLIATLSGVSWSIADRLAGHVYASAADRWWNLAMQMLVFATVAATVSALRNR